MDIIDEDIGKMIEHSQIENLENGNQNGQSLWCIVGKKFVRKLE